MEFTPLGADRWLVIQANRAARATLVGRASVTLLARWLSLVEIGLMFVLGPAGRPASALRMLGSVSIVYVACDVLGWVWPRKRPFTALTPEVRALVEHDSSRSFPSRHVASGLAMALVGHTAHPRLGLAMAQVALLLGASRIAAGLHYPSDVLGGAALGLLVGRYARGE